MQFTDHVMYTSGWKRIRGKNEVEMNDLRRKQSKKLESLAAVEAKSGSQKFKRGRIAFSEA